MKQKRFTRIKTVLVIFFLYLANIVYGNSQVNNYGNQFPQATFKSTSTIQTSYSVPPLNSDGTAYVPYSGSNRISRPPYRTTDGLDTGEGDEQSGGDAPIGDIDIYCILIFILLYTIIYRNKIMRLIKRKV